MKKLPLELLQKCPSKRFILIGMPGSGKSTLGKIFAKENNLDFYDTDELVEKNIGMPVSQFILSYGEKAFRQEELKVCRALENKTNCVIATGGGIIVLPDSINSLKKNSFIIQIKRPLESLVLSDRPLSPNIEAAKELYAKRKDLYNKYSDFIFEVSD